MRMIAVFNKTDSARFISHLDLQRAMQRAMRRAELPVKYSQGFNPHSVLSFASAPPVGMSSFCEIMDVSLDDALFSGDVKTLMQSFNSVLPDNLKVTHAVIAPDTAPSPMAALEAADYELKSSWTGDKANEAVRLFLESGEVTVEKKSKSGIKQINIRPMVFSLCAESDNDGSVIKARVSLCEKASVRPEMLVRALCGLIGDSECKFDVTRTLLLARRKGKHLPLIEIYGGENLSC